MHYVKMSAAILLLISSAVHAMEENNEAISPLTIIEQKITLYEQDPQVKNLAQSFEQNSAKMKRFTQIFASLDEHQNATLIVHALLVSFKARGYPVDQEQKITNNVPRSSERLMRIALYALDNICSAHHQAHNKTLEQSDQIPPTHLENDYALAINRLEGQIRLNGALHVATYVQGYLRLLNKNK